MRRRGRRRRETQKGAPIVIAYLSAADVVLGNESFRYVREIVDENANMAVLEFELDLDGTHVNGVDIITWNEEGKMLEKMKG